MMTRDELLQAVPGLTAEAIDACVGKGWVRPAEDEQGALYFEDIDVARLRLIFELKLDLAINDAGVPVVLALLDQIFHLRRVIRRVGQEVDKGENALRGKPRQIHVPRPGM